ncbi:MAG: DUF1343 domain-containing protein [Sorangiineae bacterium]|nr:DUF1343 domain-containing protein [Polyangiaceae bacterium]MEB2322957.1 DUF1343 domain-containing protein [Sorangiineae bacterium]
MLSGIDQLHGSSLSNLRRRLRDARVGVLTHAATLDRRGRGTLAVLEELGAGPSVIFSPEHGLAGAAQAFEAVAGSGEATSGPAVVSLYGAERASLTPSAEHLAQLDLLVIDLADVGSRYYTYVWSALLALRAAAAAGVHTVVLDRPNPISGDPETLEGAPQADGFLSFVGLEPLPIRHAHTLGELLARFAESGGLALGAEGALSVVPTRGWERHRTAEAWSRPFIPPSPNMPTLETALVYPGACLLEGTSLSEGRGTTTPFQMVGAPHLDGAALAARLTESGVVGALVRPVSFIPTFDKFAGQLCHGVMLHVTSAALFRPVAAYLRLIAFAREQAPERFAFRTEPYEFETEIPAFDLLTGSGAARQALEGGRSADELVELVAPVDPSWKDAVREAEARLERAQA